MSGGEFDFIERFFRPLAGEGALGLRDDAALLDVPEGRQLILLYRYAGGSRSLSP